MPDAIKAYVRHVEALNRILGKFAMYLVFAMMGILLFSSVFRTIFNVPHIWAVEMAQFTMAAYYFLGGGFSMMPGAHVRMDVLYSKWTPKKRAVTDAMTIFCKIFYPAVLLIGGLSSTLYSLEYGQRNYSSWGPLVAPSKIIMVIGIFMILLQAIAIFFRDLAKVKGVSIQ